MAAILLSSLIFFDAYLPGFVRDFEIRVVAGSEILEAANEQRNLYALLVVFVENTGVSYERKTTSR